MSRKAQLAALGCGVPYTMPPRRGLGASAADTAKGVGVSVASKAAGGAVSSAAVSSGLIAAGGLAAGAVTLGVGLVVAFALGKLLTKNYLNVPAMNAAEDQDVAAYNQYLTVMGQAPGRAYGLQAMLAVFRGANHSGLFPSNNGVQCFHNGCSKYPGRGDWVNGFVNDYGVHGNINFPDAFFRFSQDRNAADFGALAYNPHPIPGAAAAPSTAPYSPPPIPPGITVVNAPPTTATPTNFAVRSAVMAQPLKTSMPIVRMPALPPFRGRIGPAQMLGLGRLGQAGDGTADAVNFVDNFLLPYNTQHNTWVVPHTSTEHQILYDVADAYLASKGIQTTPFVSNPTVAQPPLAPVAPVAVPPHIADTMMPNYSPTPVPPSAQPIFLPMPVTPPVYALPPPQSSVPNYGTSLDGGASTPDTGNPPLFGMAASTGGGLTSISPALLIGGALALLAGSMLLGKKHRRRR